MRNPEIQKVVERIEASGHQSAYLDRLRGRVDAARAQSNLEAELLQEMAEALGRSEDKVLLALLQLEVLEKEIAALEAARPVDRARLAAKVDAFNAQREVALRARLDLLIHREAVGFRRNEGIEATYPVPRARPRP